MNGTITDRFWRNFCGAAVVRIIKQYTTVSGRDVYLTWTRYGYRTIPVEHVTVVGRE